jgi:dolichol-phosphate mannosyltransferase
MDGITYSVVIPVFNEQEVLKESYRRLKDAMERCGEPYELIFVNDGSRDETLSILRGIAAADKSVRYLSFSRNFGHQTAITAGMDLSSGKAVIVIDADLQDPPEVMLEMMEKWKQGFDVVYGKRVKRKGETAFKKITASVFYRFLRSMTDVDVPVDAGDFRLIDRRVCDALKSLPERNRYVRGLVSWVGFKQGAVDYVREERFAGTTKYPLKKMLKFASDALTSFSYKPLKFSIWLGTGLSCASFIFLLVVVIRKLAGAGSLEAGWSSLAAISLFFNGVILVMLGVIGEYIGRIYDEAKGRPLYIVAEKAGFEQDAK